MSVIVFGGNPKSTGAFTCDLRELEELLNRMETKDLLDLAMRRTRWICDSSGRALTPKTISLTVGRCGEHFAANPTVARNARWV